MNSKEVPFWKFKRDFIEIYYFNFYRIKFLCNKKGSELVKMNSFWPFKNIFRTEVGWEKNAYDSVQNWYRLER